MIDENSDIQLTKIESIFIVGIIGCMLFATWELGHLIADNWLKSWVEKNAFVNRRIVLYGIAFFMSISSVLITTRFAFQINRFTQTIGRAFLWYGTLLLISTIAIFVFDCIPEVFAGFIGAGIFIVAIYFLQKKYFTKERLIRNRLEKNKCFGCGSNISSNTFYCSHCGMKVGKKCSECNSFTKLMDKFCASCGKLLKEEKREIGGN